MVSFDVLRKRGANPQDPFYESIKVDAEKAVEEVIEAADSEKGLFDLPTDEDGDSNVTTGGPLGYSETSPYVWTDIAASAGRAEDSARRGTGDV
jgi:hypothetical protein